jgi:hypothetical protein
LLLLKLGRQSILEPLIILQQLGGNNIIMWSLPAIEDHLITQLGDFFVEIYRDNLFDSLILWVRVYSKKIRERWLQYALD